MQAHLSRSLPLALALLVSCAKGADRLEAPLDQLHYPAGLAVSRGQLLVANADQDLAYLGGSLLGLDPSTGVIQGGVAVPYMAGRVKVADDAASTAGCALGPDFPFALPFAMVPGRSEDTLFFVKLPFPSEGGRRIELRPNNAAYPYEAALTCGADGTTRAWVSYQRGLDEKGYVAQLDLSVPAFPPPIVQVFTGSGAPRSFAWDQAHDRLYFTTREFGLRAPIRWIGIGRGCQPFEGGVQDERRGGCHVDLEGIDLSSHLAGAEPSGIALSTEEVQCVGRPTGELCRRMYLTVRMYDADLARMLDARPGSDLGGKLVVLELAESGLGEPAVRWLDDVDIGKIAGDLLVIPRAGRGDLVVATVDQDDLVWVYDDERGAVAKVFGKLVSGVPELGHKPAGLASMPMEGDVVRVFVAAYEDHFVSAIDIPLADPAQAHVVMDGGIPARPVRFGRPQ